MFWLAASAEDSYVQQREHRMRVGTKNPVIQGCGTHHIAVQTRDWDASLTFYLVYGLKIHSFRFGMKVRPR